MLVHPRRAHGLDFVRGCCAVLVVCYHLLIWKSHVEMHSWGLYGVYIFFVLSGASLTLAYRNKLEQGYPLASFMLLRIARLGPLFLLVSVVMIAFKAHAEGLTPAWLASSVVSTSLLFGLGNAGANSLVLGGWSLGIEVVFYLVFPLMLAFAFSRYRWWAAAIAVIVQTAFVELVLIQHPDLRAAWDTYTQPLAFVAYFFFGCIIGRSMLLHRTVAGWQAAVTGVLCAAGVLLLGAPTAAATLTGWHGIVLFALSVALVFAAAQYQAPPGWQRTVCKLAGEVSYGTYLLHPLVFIAVSKLLPAASTATALALTLAGALAGAWTIERWFEWPVRERARKIIENHMTRTT